MSKGAPKGKEGKVPEGFLSEFSIYNGRSNTLRQYKRTGDGSADAAGVGAEKGEELRWQEYSSATGRVDSIASAGAASAVDLQGRLKRPRQDEPPPSNPSIASIYQASTGFQESPNGFNPTSSAPLNPLHPTASASVPEGGSGECASSIGKRCRRTSIIICSLSSMVSGSA